MKTTIITVILSFLLLNINASEKKVKAADVPDVVKTSLNQKFPGVTVKEWGKENDTNWEAEFMLNGIEHSACFDNNGIWKETEQEIKMKDVPAIVKAALEKEFPGFKVEDPELKETATGKTYDFEVEKGDDEFEISIDLEGNLVKKEKDSDN